MILPSVWCCFAPLPLWEEEAKSSTQTEEERKAAPLRRMRRGSSTTPKQGRRQHHPQRERVKAAPPTRRRRGNAAPPAKKRRQHHLRPSLLLAGVAFSPFLVGGCQVPPLVRPSPPPLECVVFPPPTFVWWCFPSLLLLFWSSAVLY